MAGENDLFTRMDSTNKSYLRTKSSAPKHDSGLGPRIVKLPEGAVPDYVKLTPYQEFCWRTIRITSYNVCYTKLLRPTLSTRRS